MIATTKVEISELSIGFFTKGLENIAYFKSN